MNLPRKLNTGNHHAGIDPSEYAPPQRYKLGEMKIFIRIQSIIEIREQRIEVGAEENTEIRRILRCPVIVVDHRLRLHVLQVVRALEGGGMEVGRIERAIGDHHRREELVLEADPLDLGLALLGVVAGFGKILRPSLRHTCNRARNYAPRTSGPCS